MFDKEGLFISSVKEDELRDIKQDENGKQILMDSIKSVSDYSSIKVILDFLLQNYDLTYYELQLLKHNLAQSNDMIGGNIQHLLNEIRYYESFKW